LLILPGTKNTIEDLLFLREEGIADEIIELSKEGCMIIGICGGYQMLGEHICDPHHVESSRESVDGLGLLPVKTTFAPEKQTYQVKAYMSGHNRLFCVVDELGGYEIHMGETRRTAKSAKPFAAIIERAGKRVDIQDGCISQEGNVMGTYIHGIFDNDDFRFKLILHLEKKKGQRPSRGYLTEFKRIKEQKYDELADMVRQNVNMGIIYDMMKMV
jgi:adenosylcobyric acid synthase